MVVRRWVAVAALVAATGAAGAGATLALPSLAEVSVPTTSASPHAAPQTTTDAVERDPPGPVDHEHLAQAPLAVPVPPPPGPDASAEQAQAAAAAAAAARALPGAPSPSGSLGIPARLLTAYQASAVHGSRCGLPWQVVAAVGLVESSHARGGRVFPDGVTWEPILGPVLDGRGVGAIRDTDAGALDGDSTWDRAVGPMQFIPATWAWIGVDADGSGAADPSDVDDAAAATARYLCAHGGDLRDPEQMSKALLRYNNSQSYVDLVLAWAQAYGGGVVATETPAPPAPAPVPAPSVPGTPPAPPAPPPPAPPPPPPTPQPTATPAPTATPQPSATPDPTTAPEPTPDPAPTAPADPTGEPTP